MEHFKRSHKSDSSCCNAEGCIFLSSSCDRPDRTSVEIILLALLVDLLLFPFTSYFFPSFFFFFRLRRHFAHAWVSHTYTLPCAHTKGNCTGRNTHSLVLFQLMERLVRCPMCRTHGSLPIHWITLNRRAHSSAGVIVLMDGNNIQTAAWSRRLRLESRVFLWRRAEVCLFLSPCFYFHSLSCVCLCFGVSLGSRPDCSSGSAGGLYVY